MVPALVEWEGHCLRSARRFWWALKGAPGLSRGHNVRMPQHISLHPPWMLIARFI